MRFHEEVQRGNGEAGTFPQDHCCRKPDPPPPGINPEAVIALHKLAAKEALIMYAQKHEDFGDLLAEAAFDNLFDTILTDDLFKPVEGFTPTDEERAKMEEAEKTAKALSGLFDILKRF